MDAGTTVGTLLPLIFLLKFHVRALSGQLGQFSQNEQTFVTSTQQSPDDRFWSSPPPR